MNQAAYVELLSAAPGSCSAIRKELERIHGLRIPGSTYQALMNSLIALFGIDGATIVAGDAVGILNARKAMTRIMGKREKGLVEALLMGDITKAAKRGRSNLANGHAAAIASQYSKPRTRRKRIITHDHIQLPSVEYGCGLTRSNAIGYRPIQTITNLGCTTLKARSNWREKNLENYLEKHWTELDFGLGQQLQLCGRQVELSDSREKVDLLAQLGNVIIPIELKIKRAGGSDLTQLQSYRQDLINRGAMTENVLGILVAPQFSSKVLNVVKGSSGVILRWFEMPM